MSEIIQNNNQNEMAKTTSENGEKTVEIKFDVKKVREKFYSRYKTGIILDIAISCLTLLVAVLLCFVPFFDHAGIATSSFFDEIKCVIQSIGDQTVQTSTWAWIFGALFLFGLIRTCIVIVKSVITNVKALKSGEKTFLLWHGNVVFGKNPVKEKRKFRNLFSLKVTAIYSLFVTISLMVLYALAMSIVCSTNSALEYFSYTTFATISSVTAMIVFPIVFLGVLLIVSHIKKTKDKVLKDDIVLDGYKNKETEE